MTITTIDALAAIADELSCPVRVLEDYLTGMQGPNRDEWEFDLETLREAYLGAHVEGSELTGRLRDYWTGDAPDGLHVFRFHV